MKFLRRCGAIYRGTYCFHLRFLMRILNDSGKDREEIAVLKHVMLACFIVFPTGALAQSPDLEATCKTVAKNFFLSDGLAIGLVQSFPELKPPGVRMTYSTSHTTSRNFAYRIRAMRPMTAMPTGNGVSRRCAFSCNVQRSRDGRKRLACRVLYLLGRSQEFAAGIFGIFPSGNCGLAGIAGANEVQA